MYVFNKYTLFHIGIILILVLGFYSGLSGGVRTLYHFSLCVVSLFSSRFTASALVWFSNFLKYLVFHFFISQYHSQCIIYGYVCYVHVFTPNTNTPQGPLSC
jgi:hypothetical protein